MLQDLGLIFPAPSAPLAKGAEATGHTDFWDEIGETPPSEDAPVDMVDLTQLVAAAIVPQRADAALAAFMARESLPVGGDVTAATFRDNTGKGSTNLEPDDAQPVAPSDGPTLTFAKTDPPVVIERPVEAEGAPDAGVPPGIANRQEGDRVSADLIQTIGADVAGEHMPDAKQPEIVRMAFAGSEPEVKDLGPFETGSTRPDPHRGHPEKAQPSDLGDGPEARSVEAPVFAKTVVAAPRIALNLQTPASVTDADLLPVPLVELVLVSRASAPADLGAMAGPDTLTAGQGSGKTDVPRQVLVAPHAPPPKEPPVVLARTAVLVADHVAPNVEPVPVSASSTSPPEGAADEILPGVETPFDQRISSLLPALIARLAVAESWADMAPISAGSGSTILMPPNDALQRSGGHHAPVRWPELNQPDLMVTLGASSEQSGGIELTLQPETLGRMRFDMRQDEAGLSITLSAEEPETVELMRRHLPELVAELKSAGIQASSLSFGAWGDGRQPQHAQHLRDAPDLADQGEAWLPPPPVVGMHQTPASSSQELNLRL